MTNNRTQKVVKKIISPIAAFMALETASGIFLLVCTAIAMTLANSPWSDVYEHLTHLNIGLTVGPLRIEKSLLHWVNDGLMAIFFFVVGLEIKRELLFGELANTRKAALPLLAAVGGMVGPALLYLLFNREGVASRGWGVPMATDIAFAVGILTILGQRVPFALKIFLLALAIVDDLGAVLVIAFFYTEQISGPALGFVAAVLVLIAILRRADIRHLLPYIVLGVMAWAGILASGIHATIAGVLLGFMTPATALYNKGVLVRRITELSERLVASIQDEKVQRADELGAATKDVLHDLHHISNEAHAPLDRLIHTLHPWVSFFIMPVFALLNAGVAVKGVSLELLASNSIAQGVTFGLFLGKPLGIVLACWLAIRLKIADLPKGVNWSQLWGAGFLGGIGFTMALFVSGLALGDTGLEIYSKLAILVASSCAALVGLVILFLASPATVTKSVNGTAQE